MAARTHTEFGILIRAVLGSFTNHNGLFVRKYGVWYVGEALPPHSKLTPLDDYEIHMDEGTIVRVWRIPNATREQREKCEKYFLDNCLEIPYPLSVARLWVFRFVNSLPWKIEGQWCTRLPWDSWNSVDNSLLLRKPDGNDKLNPTPRTFENRLVQGSVEDVTDLVLVPV